MKELLDISYTEQNDESKLLDIYLPDNVGFDTLIYFHGGGFVSGSRKQIKRLLPIVDKGVALVSVEYPLFPDTKFPDFIEACACAVKYAYDRTKELGSSGRLFISGASAGAYITMMLCMDPAFLQNAGVDPDMICGYISESSQQFAHFKLLSVRGLDSRLERIDETAPIFYIKEGIQIPPLFLMYYSDDMCCRKEENLLFYQSLKRFLPENANLSIRELEGTHCKPADRPALIDAYYDFIRQTR